MLSCRQRVLTLLASSCSCRRRPAPAAPGRVQRCGGLAAPWGPAHCPRPPGSQTTCPPTQQCGGWPVGPAAATQSGLTGRHSCGGREAAASRAAPAGRRPQAHAPTSTQMARWCTGRVTTQQTAEPCTRGCCRRSSGWHSRWGRALCFAVRGVGRCCQALPCPASGPAALQSSCKLMHVRVSAKPASQPMCHLPRQQGPLPPSQPNHTPHLTFGRRPGLPLAGACAAAAAGHHPQAAEGFEVSVLGPPG
jgi:hypothetical protein